MQPCSDVAFRTNRSIALDLVESFDGKSKPHLMSQEPPMGEVYCVAFEEGQAMGDDVGVVVGVVDIRVCEV